MRTAIYYLYIMLGAVLGVLVCIAYCALVRVSKEYEQKGEAGEHIEPQSEHDGEETSTKGKNQ